MPAKRDSEVPFHTLVYKWYHLRDGLSSRCATRLSKIGVRSVGLCFIPSPQARFRSFVQSPIIGCFRP